jgi:hypothetical protein
MALISSKAPSATKSLVGARRRSAEIDPAIELEKATMLIEELRSKQPATVKNLKDLKQRYSAACRNYYTVAAISRRKVLDETLRAGLLSILYSLRAQLEAKIIDDLRMAEDYAEVWREATNRSFFGFSAKQGVSIRYPLYSCVPTRECGARCYGHDGRDRELHLIFRGALNYLCGDKFENGLQTDRKQVLQNLDPAIRHAVRVAIREQRAAAENGYKREARIRFAHVGEMAATPAFTNALAAAIKDCDPSVACVIYTRHPKCSALDPSLFRINFTLDAADDQRGRFAPGHARLVSSAWDGKVSPHADINFLEHHVEKGVRATGKGFVCPVTADHSSIPTCDSARCDACFRSKRLKASSVGFAQLPSSSSR